jgi:hypothetical protein
MQQTLWVVGKVPNGRVAKTYSAFATGQCLRDNLAALANLPLLVIAARRGLLLNGRRELTMSPSVGRIWVRNPRPDRGAAIRDRRQLG